MLDHRTIHDLMQNIDDKWVEEAIYAERKNTVFRKFVAAAAILFICVLISTSVAAAISPTFREWIMEQFPGQKPKIEKMTLPEGINGTENGFLIQDMDGENTKVFSVENEGIVPCETKTWESYVFFHGKKYDFSFKYAIKGKDVYAWDYQGVAISMTGYDEYTGIVCLVLDDIWNCYYIDYYAQSKPYPVVDPYELEEVWKLYLWNDNEEKPEGSMKLCGDVHVSSDGSWLLYRSNRNYYMYFMEENGEHDWNSKGEWYVRNRETGEEKRLSFASPYLHYNEIGFVDDDVISILWSEENYNHPILYDCESSEIEKIDSAGLNTTPFSIHYEMVETEEAYQFRNYYENENYVIQKDDGAKMQASYATENLICIMETSGTMKLYLVNEKKVLDFSQAVFEEMESVQHVYDLGANRFVIVGSRDGRLVGYLIEF